MNNRSINAITDVIIRPTTCFVQYISKNTKFYLSSAIVIFTIAGCVAILSDILYLNHWNNNDVNYLGGSAISLSLSVIHKILQNFVMIVAIFFVGKKLGGCTSFKKIFSTLSYCFIPMIIGAVLIPLLLTFASQIQSGGIGGGPIDPDPDLSPSYAWDFASSAIISNGFSIGFGLWMLVLLFQATKIANIFDVKKSIITVAIGLVITFFSQMAFGMISSIFISSWNVNEKLNCVGIFFEILFLHRIFISQL